MRAALAFACALAAGGCGGAQRAGGDGVATGGRAAYSAEQLARVVDLGEVAIAPDGREVAFTTDRSGAFELWTLELARAPDGGWRAAEPAQRTRANEYVSGLVYSPDSGALIFEMDHGGDERTDLWILRRGAPAPERLTDTPATAERGVRFSPDGRTIAFERDPDRPFRFNIHTMDLATRAVTQRTREPVSVQTPRFSRDGRTLVATRTGDDLRGELMVLDLVDASAPARTVAPPRADGIAWAVDFLPGGALLASATTDAGFMRLATLDLARNRWEFEGPSEWDVESTVASHDGAVAYARNVHGQSEVAFRAAGEARGADLTGSAPAAPRVLSREGVVSDLAIDRDGTTLVMLREASNHPPELVAVDPRTGTTSVLVAPQLAGVRTELLARAELRTLASFDGRPIDAFVLRPPVARLGTPPPAIVSVHSGPNSQARGAFSPLTQALCEAGFLVVAPNYRGSTGYGRAFEDLNHRDWGGGDLRDLIAVVNALARAGEIDPARVGITGGSYGGYMTLRAITAEPAVWHAAVDMFGMPDLEADYQLTADRFGSWYQTEMGDFTRDRALYRDRSPIHQLGRVTAPLMVLQGANDANVPRVESDQVVAALRARRHPVEYVVYPDEGHGFTHREHRIDSIARTVAFFTRYLGRRAR